jgi:CheY-like chemotaxis protein
MSRKRILVADDDESLRRVTQMELEELGYDVVTAADGHAALRRLAEAPVPLVISDLKMPGMSW